MFNYLKESFKRKKARRITREYPAKICQFNLEQDGLVEFANWENPLVDAVTITQAQIAFYRQFIRTGDFVIDIGANIGSTTVPMAIAAGSQGFTLAFDPNPYVFKILQVNAALNQTKTNIKPYLNAITAEETEFYYASSDASFANGGIAPTAKNKHGKFVHPDKIQGIDLVRILKKHYANFLDRLAFIKIDTEGYDKEILKSTAEIIQKYRPVIIAESFGKSSLAAKKELFDVLAGFGYMIWHFADFAAGTPITKVENAEKLSRWRETINIYALPTESHQPQRHN